MCDLTYLNLVVVVSQKQVELFYFNSLLHLTFVYYIHTTSYLIINELIVPIFMCIESH
jgi:hypothetical protein